MFLYATDGATTSNGWHKTVARTERRKRKYDASLRNRRLDKSGVESVGEGAWRESISVNASVNVVQNTSASWRQTARNATTPAGNSQKNRIDTAVGKTESAQISSSTRSATISRLELAASDNDGRKRSRRQPHSKAAATIIFSRLALLSLLLVALISIAFSVDNSHYYGADQNHHQNHHHFLHHHHHSNHHKSKRQLIGDAHTQPQQNLQCAVENEICTSNNAQICKNNTCVSACLLRGMRECVCDTEEENYCYLCCGNADNKCLPAHEHDILRNNGERWERDACARCRMNGVEMEGSACDDRDAQRLCLQGKCSKSVCHAKHEGAYCDRKQEKVCVDDICDNPCAKIAPHLMVCDCPAIDPDTGFASEDRCQLCCYDFNVKPASRRCQSAFRKYRIANAQNRPIWRVGLECAGGKRCNRYGICTNGSPPRASTNPALPMALFLVALVLIAIFAAVFTTSERF